MRSRSLLRLGDDEAILVSLGKRLFRVTTTSQQRYSSGSTKSQLSQGPGAKNKIGLTSGVDSGRHRGDVFHRDAARKGRRGERGNVRGVKRCWRGVLEKQRDGPWCCALHSAFPAALRTPTEFIPPETHI